MEDLHKRKESHTSIIDLRVYPFDQWFSYVNLGFELDKLRRIISWWLFIALKFPNFCAIAAIIPSFRKSIGISWARIQNEVVVTRMDDGCSDPLRALIMKRVSLKCQGWLLITHSRSSKLSKENRINLFPNLAPPLFILVGTLSSWHQSKQKYSPVLSANIFPTRHNGVTLQYCRVFLFAAPKSKISLLLLFSPISVVFTTKGSTKRRQSCRACKTQTHKKY